MPDLSARVRRFLERRIEAIEQLEILLLLYQHADRWWGATAVADMLRLTPQAAAQHLEALGRRDLLDVRIGGEVGYRFNPATDELAAAMKQVADAYRDNRTPIVAFVSARRMRSLQAFSDAFRIKSDEDQDDG